MPKRFAHGENWYHTLFDNYQGQKIVGEASNSYSATGVYKETPQRIFEYNPNAKFIYIVRNPVDRTESDWMEYNKRKPISFSEFIRNDELSRDKNQYLKQYEAYLRYFPSDSILILTFDQIVSNSDEIRSKIFHFIGIANNQIRFSDSRATTGQKKRSRLFYWLIQKESYSRIRRFIPKSILHIATRLTSKKNPAIRPTWSEADRHWFQNSYRQPTMEFFKKAQTNKPDWRW